MPDPFALPNHHAPGIPCGATSLRPAKRPLAFWYSEEPEGITCRHRACRAAARRIAEERAATPLAHLAAIAAEGKVTAEVLERAVREVGEALA